VHRPRLLIADEPTGDLDAESAREVYTLLADLVAEHDTAAIVVSHDPASAEIAERVIHIRDGRVSEESRGTEETAVVGAGGWLRIPEDVLLAAGIHDRARVVPGEDCVALHPVDGRHAPGRAEPKSLRGARGELLEARSVSRSYGSQRVLDRIDGTFEPGELTVVTGPSGSGKSTLLALLSGLDVPDVGEILVGGACLSTLDRDARAAFRSTHIAIVGQIPGLLGFLTARENVELGVLLRDIDPTEASERAAETLAAVGLAEHADRRVDLLSAGQRERVALARAFAARAAVVIADEPTSRLDAAATVAIGRLLADLARSTGTTVVCATHDPLLIELADREVRLSERVPTIV
jgi:ABC-type lipoprotein export system ATPase subunit